MIPVVNQYPEFVADQLLTSDDLNNMFGFLEEQERLTRTSMIGIGIVCGLEVKTAVDGTSITITGGAGATSEGYLIKLETDTYFEYKDFDAVKPRHYDGVFVNTTVEADGKMKHTQKFPIWELFAKSETDAKKLDKTFLNDKVVLLFYEMLEQHAKNCDPTSCDDKGTDVFITVRRLLVTKDDAEKLLPKEKNVKPIDPGGLGLPVLTDITSLNPFHKLSAFSGLGFTSAAFEDILMSRLKLPDLIMRRYDVTATNLTTSNDVFERYQDIFTKTFVDSTGSALSQLYFVYRSLLLDVSSGNPFGNFANKFAFLHNNTISGNRLLHFQYYYDLFSDLLQAYNEMRWLGVKLIAQCCPDSSLFPRHLLLGEAIPVADQQRSRFRHYFIPSPVLNNNNEMVLELKLLFRRLLLMVEKFETPVPVVFNKDNIDANIRITPSRLGDVKLSEKSLPFYYKVNDATGRLFLNWSYEKTRRDRGDQVLSYHAALYNNSDDFVLNPLRYEIEPYNFFRIEGHVGKSYKTALSSVVNIRNRFRLPFDVVVLRASLNNGEIDFSNTQCHFQDLDTVYNSLKAELTCLFCREMVYYYAIPPDNDNLATPKDNIPAVPLLKACSPGFRYAIRTFGHEFEQIYPSIRNQEDINLNFVNPGLFVSFVAAQFNPYVFRRALLFYMEKIFENMKTFISQVDIDKLDFYHNRLRSVADLLRKMLKNQLATVTDHARQVELEDEIDHLDVLLFACTQKPFDELVKKYKERIAQLNNLRQLSKFVQKHPGIEHKAGVPKGGTFILVYHERPREVTIQPGAALDAGDVVAVNPGFTTAIAVNPGFTDAIALNPAATPTISGSRLSFSNINKLVRDLRTAGLSTDKLSLINDDLIKIGNLKPGLFDTKVTEITDGTVIADFYLPYLCCSDCAPVHFIITEPNVIATIALDKMEFCSDDKTNFVFKVSPAGGVVTGEGVISDNNIFSFNPSATVFSGTEKEKEITFTYVVEDKTATLKIKVFKKPIADFEFVPAPGSSHRDIIITNKSQFGSLFDWDFGESSDPSDTSTKESPGNHIYKDEGEYTITLKVTNGICSTTITKVVNIVAPGNVNISLLKKEFCSDDKTEHLFTISPNNTKVTGEGVEQKTAGFVFIPAKVNVDTILNKTVSFKGTSAGNLDGGFAAVVHHRPSKPAFNFERVGTTDEVIFTITQSEFAQVFQWKFGDGQVLESEKRQVRHQYLQQGGDFVVTLVGVNGPCSSEPATVTVPLPPVVIINKTCIPINRTVTEFEKLQSLDPNLFTVFTQQLASFKEIRRFFAEFDPLAAKPAEEQLQFFTNKKVATLLEPWLTETAAMFSSDFRTLSFELFKILTDMSMLVACVKKEDIGGGDIKMSGVFKNISANLNKLGTMINPPGVVPVTLPADQKKILSRMKNGLDDELTRVAANNENKPAYKEIVGKLINTMKAMGF
ncbi:MAG: hypothetical protein HOP10_04200 [Chitinophagaceae bacterium]|nr:hypothetical protein [Chitinophagaceae bacterium]